MTRPLASACVDVCRELLAGEPEMLADFDAIFTDAGTRWDRLPTDLRLGLADIVWERLGERGLAPEPEPSARGFIRRTELRCPTCGGAPPDPWWDRCEECVDTGWVRQEARVGEPPTLCAALTLASLPMLALEANAREAAAALWPWRGRRGGIPRASDPPTAVAWRVHEGDGPLLLMRGTEALCPLLFEALARAALDRRGYDRANLLTPRAQVDYQYRRQRQWEPAPQADRAAAELYAALQASGETVGPNGLHGALPSRGLRVFAPIGRPWSSLPSPFPSLLELWDHGVAVERLGASTIVLALAP
ncbi:MAG: hypothetical protein H6713_30255 [Myxococcales bacterium]|nr:hypothetical protein [Myxococcales bacterium]MCB9754248.1 hypothetical protein [Myxococcales bacterium]